MKRGFLNTDKAKRKLATATDDKGKKAETPQESVLDLHCVPPCITSNLKHPPSQNRFIFRCWPRDPNGKIILPSEIRGKEAGNGLDLWGATLFDFYRVRRIPDNAHLSTISTGSKLTKVMKNFGELDHAKDEIAWAAREVDPVEIPAWDPSDAISIHERRVHASVTAVDHQNKIPDPDAVVQVSHASDSDTLDSVNQDANEAAVKDLVAEHSAKEPMNVSADSKMLPSLDISLDSPFHPSHYPAPWPLVPFESPCSPFALRRRIPIHLLPKKLYVHDPWECLKATYIAGERKAESWRSKTDLVRTYSLSLSPESQSLATSKASAAKDDEPEVFIYPQEREGPSEQPAIRAILPKRPRLTEVSDAHLYISPKGRLGDGHHSIVYEADFELPRDLFCESTYCKPCLDEQIKVEIDCLKESGEWERRMNEAAREYESINGQDTVSRDTPSSSSVQSSPRYVGCVKVRLEHVPMEVMSMAAATDADQPPPSAAASPMVRVSDEIVHRHVKYEGLVITIHPNIQWQNPVFPDTLCEHQVKKKKSVPRTATFRVAAKLSLPRDPHLEREASNYLKFPAHFFQHWNGYNVIPPLHDPTPVGALVPQFFGYYTPDASSDRKEGHRSPILLIEHCGEPIEAAELSLDDKHECAALLFRFHSAGWLHNSFAERNIVQQKQHPTCSPLEEQGKCPYDIPHRHRPYTFRMIDFGRSMELEDRSSRATEEMMAKKLFDLVP